MDLEKLTRRINDLLGDRTAYWLAQQSGLSIPQCDKLIKGGSRRPSHEMLGKIAKAFGLTSVDELLEGTSVPDLPTEGLHPVVIAAAKRVGKYLDEAAWNRVAGYMEAVAEDKRMENPEQA